MKPIQLFIEVSALKVQKMVSQAPFPAKKTRAEWEGINQYYLCKIVRKWKPICIHFHDEVSVYITEYKEEYWDSWWKERVSFSVMNVDSILHALPPFAQSYVNEL